MSTATQRDGVWDAIVLGGGAAGLHCAATAAQHGCRVLVLEHTRDCGRKILMSGGGRCNFTNLDASPEHFQSQNPHFCKSALARYTPEDFFKLAQGHGVDWVEKAPGQLFCRDSARPILNLLLEECRRAGVKIQTHCSVSAIEAGEQGFRLQSSQGEYTARQLVVATGGLSIPRMGATGFGYELAKQFGHALVPTAAALVPFTLSGQPKADFAELQGISTPVELRGRATSFRDDLLLTHRGLSGPACLQLSSFWTPGETLHCDWLPGIDAEADLLRFKQKQGRRRLSDWLAQLLPRRLADRLARLAGGEQPVGQQRDPVLRELVQRLQNWPLRVSGTEGYRTAEVTRGGVATDEIDSRRMASRRQRGLYFVGEVLDVTGQLGGYNFQWAWSSGHAAGEAIAQWQSAEVGQD